MTTAILATTFLMATMAPPMDGPRERQGLQQLERPRIAGIFEKADGNNDGVIDQQEFARAIRKLIDRRQGKGERGGSAGETRRDRIGRGEGPRSDAMRGEGRGGQGRRGNRSMKPCFDELLGNGFDGPPMQGRGFGNRRQGDGRRGCDRPCEFEGARGFNGPCGFNGPRGFDGPRGKSGKHDRRGHNRLNRGCDPMMDCGGRGNRSQMIDQLPRNIKRMIKNAVAEALGELQGKAPMGLRDRGQSGKDRGPARQMNRDCGKGMMPPSCDPAQCGEQMRQRDGAGRRSQRGERAPRGDRAERFQRLDTNGDGVLTLDEFNAGPNRDGFDKPKGDGPRKEKRPMRGEGRRGGRGSAQPEPQRDDSL